MEAITGDMFPPQHLAASVSTGTGLANLGKLHRMITIITAGILYVTLTLIFDVVDMKYRVKIWVRHILLSLNTRNPDQSLMPWCRVRKGRRYVREFCNIPKCKNNIRNVKIIEI